MSADGSIQCRGWGELCVGDSRFDFTFTEGDRERIISSLQYTPHARSIWYVLN